MLSNAEQQRSYHFQSEWQSAFAKESGIADVQTSRSACRDP
jgi:hypothetical protein